MVISFLFQILKYKHLGKFGSYTPNEPLFATAEEVLGYREGLAWWTISKMEIVVSDRLLIRKKVTEFSSVVHSVFAAKIDLAPSLHFQDEVIGDIAVAH